jgi:hypothetical protein
MAELEEKKPDYFKRIDFEADQQILIGKSGTVYTTESSLSVARYAAFQMYEKELAYGFTVDGIYKQLKVIYELVNKQKFLDAGVKVNDLMRGALKVKERQPAIMKICALYINAPDEDRGDITPEIIDKKIADWAEYDIRDFFAVATRSVRGLTEIFLTVSQAIMEQPEDLGL